jgi:hypothetical protein
MKTVAEKEETGGEGVMGAGDRVEVRWTPRVKRAEETAATVFCQNATLVSFGHGVISARSTLDYQVTQGELRQLRVRVPAGQRVLRVQGDLIRTWEVKGDTNEQMVAVLGRADVEWGGHEENVSEAKMFEEIEAMVGVGH